MSVAHWHVSYGPLTHDHQNTWPRPSQRMPAPRDQGPLLGRVLDRHGKDDRWVEMLSVRVGGGLDVWASPMGNVVFPVAWTVMPPKPEWLMTLPDEPEQGGTP